MPQSRIANAATLAVFVAALVAIAVSGRTVRSASVKIQSWQTYCAIAYEDTQNSDRKPALAFEPVGRAGPEVRTGYLFLDRAGGLRVFDVANRSQFAMVDGQFHAVAAEPCPVYEAYGHVITGAEAELRACADGHCTTIEVQAGKSIFAIARARGAVLVGLSNGDVLRFRSGRWCRMQRIGDESHCPPGDPLPVVTTPSTQFYSSVTRGNLALVGEYPSGRIFQFDGETLRPWVHQPPVETYSAESQSFAYHCGDLYVGYWPTGTVFRLHEGKWEGPVSLFPNTPPDTVFPFEDEAKAANLVSNFLGRRVSSIVPYGGDLYAITSNKGEWSRNVVLDIGSASRDYGVVHRLVQPDCSQG